jgi:hypothetical protein
MMPEHRFIYQALILTFFALGLSSAAQAEISVTHGEYAAGVLVVRGQTSQPNQRITLDGRYSERTGDNKEFLFRIRYLPKDCVVRLKAGMETRIATIANCQILGGPATKPPARKTRTVPSDYAGLFRVVRQPCEKAKECTVLCRDGEFAVNAYCADGEAKLIGERSVSCGAQASTTIVAYCMTPAR